MGGRRSSRWRDLKSGHGDVLTNRSLWDWGKPLVDHRASGSRSGALDPWLISPSDLWVCRKVSKVERGNLVKPSRLIRSVCPSRFGWRDHIFRFSLFLQGCRAIQRFIFFRFAIPAEARRDKRVRRSREVIESSGNAMPPAPFLIQGRMRICMGESSGIAMATCGILMQGRMVFVQDQWKSWTSMEIGGNQLESKNFKDNQCKSIKIHENRCRLA